jgi:hypothetical protein
MCECHRQPVQYCTLNTMPVPQQQFAHGTAQMERAEWQDALVTTGSNTAPEWGVEGGHLSKWNINIVY